jgi:ribonuclease HI
MEKITIYTRGLATGSLGPAAISVSMVDSANKVLVQVAESIGNATNEYAEYFAVVRALQLAEENFGNKTREIHFEIKLCNELVKKQLNNEAEIKDISLIGHFIEIHNMGVVSFPHVSLTLVATQQNQETDKLVREVLDT